MCTPSMTGFEILYRHKANKSNATKKGEKSSSGGGGCSVCTVSPTVIYSHLERGDRKKSEKLKTNDKGGRS